MFDLLLIVLVLYILWVCMHNTRYCWLYCSLGLTCLVCGGLFVFVVGCCFGCFVLGVCACCFVDFGAEFRFVV